MAIVDPFDNEQVYGAPQGEPAGGVNPDRANAAGGGVSEYVDPFDNPQQSFQRGPVATQPRIVAPSLSQDEWKSGKSIVADMESRVKQKVAEKGGDPFIVDVFKSGLDAIASAGSAVMSAVTGEGRKDPNIPEFDLPFEFSARQAKTALGLMTTFDPKRELNILATNYPELKFSQDEYGNILVDGSAYGGGVGYLNKPGISIRDLADAGFQIFAFTPAGRAGAAIPSLTKRMASVGGAAAGTQALLDVTGQAVGATPEISVENIDKGDVAAAGLGGAVFEALGTIAAKMLPVFRKRREINDEIRKEFKRAAKEAGGNPDDVTDEVINKYLRMEQEAVDPNAMPAVGAQNEFGIRYTKGQATNDIDQLGLEDSMRHGARGPIAEKTMRKFYEDVQQPSIEGAIKKTQEKIAGGETVIESPVQAGREIKEGLKAGARELDQAVSEAYEKVGDAYLSPDRMIDLADSVIAKAKGFIKHGKLTTATVDALNEARKFRKLIEKTGRNVKIRPFHINEIDAMRRKLSAYIDTAKNPTDRRQVTLLKKEFDTYIDNAIDDALFSGDIKAIDMLKKARKLRAEYARKYQRNDVRMKSGRPVKDEAGDIIERIVAADPTDEQVANYLFGSARLAGSKNAGSLAKRLKKALGANSREWQAIREAAFLKLTQPRKGQEITSGAVFNSRLNEAIRESPTLMNELFSKEEIAMMKRLAKAIKRAQPDPKNPSKTSYKLAEIVRQNADDLLRLMGWTVGGIKGRMTAEGVIKGRGYIGRLMDARRASKAVQGYRPLRRISTMPAIGAAGAVAVSE